MSCYPRYSWKQTNVPVSSIILSNLSKQLNYHQSKFKIWWKLYFIIKIGRNFAWPVLPSTPFVTLATNPSIARSATFSSNFRFGIVRYSHSQSASCTVPATLVLNTDFQAGATPRKEPPTLACTLRLHSQCAIAVSQFRCQWSVSNTSTGITTGVKIDAVPSPCQRARQTLLFHSSKLPLFSNNNGLW